MEIFNDFKSMTEEAHEQAKLRADEIAQRWFAGIPITPDEAIIVKLVDHIEAQSKRHVTLGLIRAAYETVLDEARGGRLPTVKAVVDRATASVHLAIQKAAAL